MSGTKKEYVDILEGLENFNYKDEKYWPHISPLTKISMYLEDPVSLLKLDDYLLSFEDGKPSFQQNIDERDKFGRSAFHWAIGREYIPGYIMLLTRRANINLPTYNEGFTPLMVSCRKGGGAKTTSYLLEHDADYTVTAKNSATAFHIATAAGNRDSMRLLILNGADPYLKLRDGRTALDLAENDRMKDLVYSCYRSAIIREEKKAGFCANCHEFDVKLDRCGKCYVTFYCSRYCQLMHWKKEHKDKCHGSLVAHLDKEKHKTPITYGKTGRKYDKTFIVEAFVTVSGGIVVTSDEKRVYARVKDSKENTKQVTEYMRNHFEGRSSVFFWAQFTNMSKKDIRVFHGKVLPRTERSIPP